MKGTKKKNVIKRKANLHEDKPPHTKKTVKSFRPTGGVGGGNIGVSVMGSMSEGEYENLSANVSLSVN